MQMTNQDRIKYSQLSERIDRAYVHFDNIDSRINRNISTFFGENVTHNTDALKAQGVALDEEFGHLNVAKDRYFSAYSAVPAEEHLIHIVKTYGLSDDVAIKVPIGADGVLTGAIAQVHPEDDTKIVVGTYGYPQVNRMFSTVGTEEEVAIKENIQSYLDGSGTGTIEMFTMDRTVFFQCFIIPDDYLNPNSTIPVEQADRIVSAVSANDPLLTHRSNIFGSMMDDRDELFKLLDGYAITDYTSSIYSYRNPIFHEKFLHADVACITTEGIIEGTITEVLPEENRIVVKQNGYLDSKDGVVNLHVGHTRDTGDGEVCARNVFVMHM